MEEIRAVIRFQRTAIRHKAFHKLSRVMKKIKRRNVSETLRIRSESNPTVSDPGGGKETDLKIKDRSGTGHEQKVQC